MSYILIYQPNFRTEANYIWNASSINRTEKINSFKGVSYPFVLYSLQLRQEWCGSEEKRLLLSKEELSFRSSALTIFDESAF